MPKSNTTAIAPEQGVHVRDLNIAVQGSGRLILQDVNLHLPPGTVTAVVGPSGSGKSTIARTLLGLTRPPLRIASGRASIGAATIDLGAGQRFDPRVASYIPQDPVASLDPVLTIGAQMKEVFRLYEGASGAKDWRARAIGLLESVGVDDAAERLEQYPHELSGGLKQRVVISMALVSKPALIVADEPTSALDVVTQRQVMSLLASLPRSSTAAVLLITHEIGLAADSSDFIVVLDQGRVVESGATRDVLANPRSALATELLDVARSRVSGVILPRTAGAAAANAGAIGEKDGEASVVVSARKVSKTYERNGRSRRGLFDVDLDVFRGETLALVGASGSGKSTLGRILMRLIAPDSGQLSILGQDALALRGSDRQRIWEVIQPVYQNPDAALDPRWTVERIVAEPLQKTAIRGEELRQRVAAVLREVELDADVAARRPGDLSGGQRQRVALARALIGEPQIVVLDEALSALDVLVQKRVLALLDRLQRGRHLTFIFISHDLGVVRRFADRIAVMSAGRLVETGPVQRVYDNPQAAETVALLDAIPGRRGLTAPDTPGFEGASPFIAKVA